MKRLLVVLSSSFPFGPGEPFMAVEFPALEAAFDEIVIISNDTASARTWPTGPTVSCERIPYELSFMEKQRALAGLLLPGVWQEFWALRRRHRGVPPRQILSTVLTSWAKARKFASKIAHIGSQRPGFEVYVYSYWANDMAIAAALARQRGAVHRALARAHGWDVYTYRHEVGFLPFRAFLADHLDALAFVSADGRGFFLSAVGQRRAELGVYPLGTRWESDAPVGRAQVPSIASCAGLIPLKRIDLLARAVTKCHRPLRWVHVGDGPERMVIQSILGTPRPGLDVVLMGHLSQPDVIAAWRNLRPWALVSVSASEGLPVSMMEAMSLGIPVLATRVGGVPEIVIDGLNGFLLHPDPTADDVANAIDNISSMPLASWENLSCHAWRTWRHRFRAEDNFIRFVTLLLGSKKPAEADSATERAVAK